MELWDLGFFGIKKNWRSLLGLLGGILLIVIGCLELNVPYYQFLTPALIIIWILIWYFKSGRLILPTRKYLLIFCIKGDTKSRIHYNKVFTKLQRELDAVNLTRKIKLIDISPDIINNRVQAEKYREDQNVDLVIWGNSFSETNHGEDIINFNLNYTYRLNRRLKAKLTLFNLDLSLVAGTRDWTIKLDNTLFEEIKVVHNFVEACLFIVGVHFLTDNKLTDAIVLLNRLKIMIASMRDDPFKKFIMGRINALIIETYFLLGRVANEDGDYKLSKEYFQEIAKYPVNKFHVYVALARLEYLLGNLPKAKQYTAFAARINRKHPVILFNRAFFKILDSRYEGALFMYKKIAKLRTIDVNVQELLDFFYDRYTENKRELAYIFAMGLVNFLFHDRKLGFQDLTNFISRAKNKPQYSAMVRYATDLVEAEKYRKKKIKKRRRRLKKR